MRSPFPYEFDPKIDRSCCRRKKKQRLEEQRCKAYYTSYTMANGDQRRTLRVFVTPGVQGITSSAARPTAEAHTLELKLALISMV